MSKPTKSLADRLFPVEDDDISSEILDIKPEQRRLNTETYDFTISTIHNYLKNKSMVIPEFQRAFVWNRAQASRLIESLIIQCPIPVIYLSQGSDETLSVIDGNQRLTSIKLYLEDEFALQGLTAYPELEGNKFSDLDSRFQKHILNRTLRCIVILKTTHPQIKFDVFERLNTGSVKLNPQELRHGIYYGPLIEAIEKLAQDRVWIDLTSMHKDKRMRSEELILRFFALYENFQEYKKPFVTYLNQFCETHRNTSKEQLSNWKGVFEQSIDSINKIYGDIAFKVYDADIKAKKTFNAALFDAQMVSFARLTNKERLALVTKKEQVITATTKLLSDEKFISSVIAHTSDEGFVKYRINRFSDTIKSLLK
ncbi:hypothetical protein PK28_04715 [Hymenobacter sp. DG25B]|uniref:DUF262 domain-containing protein n=1 Tax=Hymenobacter sp. DG25B TaxID=1385664 RepID=UPI0005411E87|nr:DUF262 domain-containing protein [Hymenobacter sp. DG25B]AIZ63167.1 hypothetical protein PK28_04715 [Hymenobacter sp. DG25B]